MMMMMMMMMTILLEWLGITDTEDDDDNDSVKRMMKVTIVMMLLLMTIGYSRIVDTYYTIEIITYLSWACVMRRQANTTKGCITAIFVPFRFMHNCTTATVVFSYILPAMFRDVSTNREATKLYPWTTMRSVVYISSDVERCFLV